MKNLAYIGSTTTILDGMFPQQDAHVTAWRRWRWLKDRTEAVTAATDYMAVLVTKGGFGRG